MIGVKELLQSIGLKISQLEDDNDGWQDPIILTIHQWTYMHTLSSTPIIKIIEELTLILDKFEL